jgi:hypothetical protein
MCVRFAMSDNWIPLREGICGTARAHIPSDYIAICHRFSRGRNEPNHSHTTETRLDQLQFVVP